MVDSFLANSGYNSNILEGSTDKRLSPFGTAKLTNPMAEASYKDRALDERLASLAGKRYLNSRLHAIAKNPDFVYEETDKKLASLSEQYVKDYGDEMKRLENIPSLSVANREQLAKMKAESGYKNNAALMNLVSPVEVDISVLTAGMGTKELDRTAAAKAETLVDPDEESYINRKMAKARSKYAAKSAARSAKKSGKQ